MVLPSNPSPLTVSCVIPCYNGSATLERSVRSVLGQDPLQDCVLVDDGSTDATLDIMRGLEQADARIRVVGLSRNSGLSSARNAGAAFATGDRGAGRLLACRAAALPVAGRRQPPAPGAPAGATALMKEGDACVAPTHACAHDACVAGAASSGETVTGGARDPYGGGVHTLE